MACFRANIEGFDVKGMREPAERGVASTAPEPARRPASQSPNEGLGCGSYWWIFFFIASAIARMSSMSSNTPSYSPPSYTLPSYSVPSSRDNDQSAEQRREIKEFIDQMNRDRVNGSPTPDGMDDRTRALIDSVNKRNSAPDPRYSPPSPNPWDKPRR